MFQSTSAIPVETGHQDGAEQAKGMRCRARLASWLAGFERALAASDTDAASKMFATDCYWRDLVAFTWNIDTMESRDAVRGMLAATLATVRPENWQLSEAGSETEGILEGYFTFETASGRGVGHIRLRAEQCWTLLTSLTELKGFEEKRGPTREQGVVQGSSVRRGDRRS
jgi:putative flavoprotein involved in K+ transport